MKKPLRELDRHAVPHCSPRILVYAGWFIGFCALMALAIGFVFLMLDMFVK